MSTTPPTFLTWAVLSTLLGAFLLFHLWKFDRFKCLRWNNGPYSGAFKRVMTYTYLLSIPLLIIYSYGFCILTYKAGYIELPGHGFMPLPFQLWQPQHHRWIFPLNMLFSIAWSCEMVTHLEELCFWLFLANAWSVQQDWFRSLYFKAWSVGSVLAVYMPIVTIVTRADPDKNTAALFIAGSLGSLSLTMWFMPVLLMFPSFVRDLKSEGVDLNTIVRLTTFHELNCIRVIFRFLFVAPLLILGVDGLTTRLLINSNLFASEFLAFVAGIGCMVSSGITLVIFFPRSIQSEVQARDASRIKSRSMQTMNATQDSGAESYLALPSPVKSSAPPRYTLSPNRRTPDSDGGADTVVSSTTKAGLLAAEDARDAVPTTTTLKTFAPNRRLDSGATVEGGVSVLALTERNVAQHNQSANVHPFVHNFKSPIYLVQGDSYQGNQLYGGRYSRAHV